jgi:flagellar motility protein MotE (MotC chaperone)
MASAVTATALRNGARGLAVLALGGMLFALGPARTSAEEVAAAAAAPVALPVGADEVQRFCSNIVDAARDRRYALQAAELDKLKADIDERMKRLEAKRLEYEEWLKRRDDFLDKAEDDVVKIYARMKPDAAAERLAEVKIELAAGILMKLSPKQASTILNEMDSKVAAVITGIMASAARKQDPS